MGVSCLRIEPSIAMGKSYFAGGCSPPPSQFKAAATNVTRNSAKILADSHPAIDRRREWKGH
jgi:hypothetical protein